MFMVWFIRKNTQNCNQSNEGGKYFCSITSQMNLKSGEIALTKAKKKKENKVALLKIQRDVGERNFQVHG